MAKGIGLGPESILKMGTCTGTGRKRWAHAHAGKNMGKNMGKMGRWAKRWARWAKRWAHAHAGNKMGKKIGNSCKKMGNKMGKNVEKLKRNSDILHFGLDQSNKLIND